jgi:Zn-finger nucleic acid-binding protein
MSDKQGVEIDYCPQCRGIWLDRGELDKIIERSNNLESQYRSMNHQQPFDHQQSFDHQYRNEQFRNDHDHYKQHKRKSWLEEMFD